MKKIMFLLFGLFILAYGCNDDPIQSDPVLDSVNLKKSELKEVPISCKGYIKIVEYTEQKFGASGTISGIFTHLGKLIEEKSTWDNMVYDFSQFQDGIVTYVGDVTLCAANGDLVFAIYSGFLNLGTKEVGGALNIYDGTGRFENVSGEIITEGYAEVDDEGTPLGNWLEGKGLITTVGSSK